MSTQNNKNLSQLGRPVAQPQSPDEAVLETVADPHPDTDYITFHMSRIHILCPITGQPDFAHFVIDYAPAEAIVENKSLKLFFGSFRNHAAFPGLYHCIGKRLISAMQPRWLRIAGYWYPRGGIPIDIFFQQGEIPTGVWVPEPGVAPYRGRG